MPEELTAPKAPRKELGLDDSRSNTPQGFTTAAGGHKSQSSTNTAGLLGEHTYAHVYIYTHAYAHTHNVNVL